MREGTLKISQQTYAIHLVEEYGVKEGESIPLPAVMRIGDLDDNYGQLAFPRVGRLAYVAFHSDPARYRKHSESSG